MDVYIDEARHKSGVTKIKYLCAGGMLDRLADGNDFGALDQDFARGDDGAGGNIQDTCGVQHDGTGISSLGQGEKGEDWNEKLHGIQ
jgi:hypothetical protein